VLVKAAPPKRCLPANKSHKRVLANIFLLLPTSPALNNSDSVVNRFDKEEIGFEFPSEVLDCTNLEVSSPFLVTR
jgi:hypothetical protein